ncbi:MAG TPA: dipeptidase [Phycisphaerales bacterium]|nr:dipeptidase [Phycisphaerales bacterium]
MSTLPLAPVLASASKNFSESVERLSDFLKIPSVSTDSAYNDATQRAAKWASDQLAELGFKSSVRKTKGHPMVVAHHPGPEGPKSAKVPHILYYGHYDVQPADPLDLWKSPPFEPTVVKSPYGKKIVARGAVDDKGQVMTFIEAFRAWMTAHKTMPVKVTVLLEGEEESGSLSLDPFLKANKKELSADVCVVSDTGMWDIKTPAITYMLRGLVYIEATLHGPSHDLHSGMYGGSLVNPATALCGVLSQLHDKNRKVQIPGFYDDVIELTKSEKKMWAALKFNEKEFLGSAGMKTPYGEKGRTTLERTWSRPTCEINGIYGGYTGKGAKTVIGASATAKISCRLVAAQDPKKVKANLMKFLKERTPVDCRWEFHDHGCSPAIRVPTSSPWLEAAQRGLQEVYKKQPFLIGTGGSIPLVGSVQKILGFDSLLVGFGLDDDRVHSPNEKFELTCYEQGIRSHAAILAEFAGLKG